MQCDLIKRHLGEIAVLVVIGLVCEPASAQDDVSPIIAPTPFGPWGVGHQVFNVFTPITIHQRMDVWYPVDISERPRGSEFCSDRERRRAERDGLPQPVCTLYEDDELTVYPEFGVWETERRSRIAVELAAAAPELFPLVIYSQGAQQSTTANTTLPEALASHGFFVAAYDSFAIFESIEFLLNNSATDGDPFHGRIDGERVGVAGSSVGASQSISALSFRREGSPEVGALLAIGWGGSDSQIENISLPTLFVVGRRDGILDRAQKNLAHLSLEENYMAITPTDHAGPTWDIGPLDTLRMVNLYAVSFFTSTLLDDDRYGDVLNQRYVWEYESRRPTEQLYFFEGAVTDANDDWRTDFADFQILSANFGHPVPFDKREGILGKSVGDFNLDGSVNFQDFLLLAINFSGDVSPANAARSLLADSFAQLQPAATAASLPEPSTYALGVLGLFYVVRLRQRVCFGNSKLREV